MDTFGTLLVVAGLVMIVMAILRLRPNLNRIEWPQQQRAHLMLLRDGYLIAAAGQLMGTAHDASVGDTFWMTVGALVTGWLVWSYLRTQDTIDQHRRRYPTM